MIFFLAFFFSTFGSGSEKYTNRKNSKLCSNIFSGYFSVVITNETKLYFSRGGPKCLIKSYNGIGRHTKSTKNYLDCELDFLLDFDLGLDFDFERFPDLQSRHQYQQWTMTFLIEVHYHFGVNKVKFHYLKNWLIHHQEEHNFIPEKFTGVRYYL